MDSLHIPHRCEWARAEAEIIYHDTEWGVPLHDDSRLFEMLTLEGAQAGLSWSTILRKRENYRRAFDGFNPALVADYGEKKIASLLNDTGIVRNKLKIRSTVSNARVFIEIQKQFGSFDEFIWRNVRSPLQNQWARTADVPALTSISDAMSKDLRKCGFRFVGTTICYAFMQATGMVNDHLTTCFRHKEVNCRE